VAIEAQLRNERGEIIEVVSGVCLQPIVPAMDDVSSPCLRFIDPHGDTMFNAWQAQPLRDELLAGVSTVDETTRPAIEGVISMLDRCAQGVHLYVWFVGD
jgi:hypothetical protein